MTGPLDLSASSSQPTSALSPSADAGPLSLTPPEPVPVIAAEQVGVMLPLKQERMDELATVAQNFAASVKTTDPLAPAFQQVLDNIGQMGNAELRSSSQATSRMLDRPVRALAAAKGEGADGQSIVAEGLVQLRLTVEDLDPSKVDSSVLAGLKKLMPFRNELRSYFAKYSSAQARLDTILRSLENGQDTLRKDNAAIDVEKQRLWTAMEKLQEYAMLAQMLDQEVASHIDQLSLQQPDRAEKLRADLLFALRQKHQDLLTQLAVSAQGYLALDVVRRNNSELIRGVERASTTTVSALRTAVIVAQALTNQKLVLDQVTALNRTTSQMIVATSQMLRTQSGEIQEMAASTSVSMEALEAAFENIYGTIETIDSYRSLATDNMAQTVTALQSRVDDAKHYLERVQERDSWGDKI